jgi:hypothetical protein
MKRYLSALCGALLALVVCAGAQSPTTPYRVDYFNKANAPGAPDAILALDNDGSAAHASICADIFVFDVNEEISERCGCLETPDDLLTLSVNNNLTARPATGAIVTSGVIMIVAAAPTNGACPALFTSRPYPARKSRAGPRTSRTATTQLPKPLHRSRTSAAPRRALWRRCAPPSSQRTVVAAYAVVPRVRISLLFVC